MTTLKEIRNRFVDKQVEQIGSKQLFKVYVDNLIIYLSYRTIVAEYDKQANILEVNPTKFSVTTTRHVNLIKRLHSTATIKEMPL